MVRGGAGGEEGKCHSVDNGAKSPSISCSPILILLCHTMYSMHALFISPS